MCTALKHITSYEFLLCAEGKEGRELHDGAPVMMSPERVAHIRAKFSAAKALDGVLATSRLPCEVIAYPYRRTNGL